MSDQSFVDEHGVTHKLSPLRFHEKRGEPIKMDTVDPDDDAPLHAMSGIARLEGRIADLEAMVKRIAAHLGIEG